MGAGHFVDYDVDGFAADDGAVALDAGLDETEGCEQFSRGGIFGDATGLDLSEIARFERAGD